ncbi:hypothetical protein Dimus_036888 [Dionaea muscipula]
MPRGQRGGGIRIAHDDEEDEFDRFRFPTAFHALVSWPRFAERGIVSGRSVDLDQVDHKYLTDLLVGYGWGGLMDLPEFSQFQHAVMERLDAFDRRFTQIRADSLRSSSNMARIQADQATQQSRIHSLLVAQAQMGSVLSAMRTDIATSEERVLQSIDSLTQLFRRRFPSPSADP